jgi:hypothetical protein
LLSPEEELLGVREQEFAIRILGVFCDMPRVPFHAELVLTDERDLDLLTRFCGPHDVEVHQAIKTHTQANGPTFQPIYEAILLILHEVPLFGFAAWRIS